jgi:hypothetical protein
MRPDLHGKGSTTDRERPPITKANGTPIMGCGFPRAGAGKILPRAAQAVEGLKQGGRQPIRRGVRGGSPALQLRALLIRSLVLSVR